MKRARVWPADEHRVKRKLAMESFSLFKMPVIIAGLAAKFVLSPACKAQSEIAPDHFDGTDSWATMGPKIAAPKRQHRLVAMQANHRRVSASSLSFATNRQSSTAFHKSAPAILSRRKATALKAEEEKKPASPKELIPSYSS